MEDDAIPAESRRKWAEPDAVLSTYDDVNLTGIGWLRIRHLSNTEQAHMGFLPDLSEWASLTREFITRDEPLSEEEDHRLSRERLHYLARVAHMAVADMSAVPDGQQLPDPIACAECGTEEMPQFVHVKSLWSLDQADHLDVPELEKINWIAGRNKQVEEVAPLSEAQTDEGSTPRADSGESIPPTNSSPQEDSSPDTSSEK